MFNLQRFIDDPVRLLIIPAALCAIIFHEYCHGLTAYRLGDQTAKESGRLSFKPWRHIDPFGLLMLVFAGFGWAKPVPVDLRYFKKPRRDFALVGLAGPMSNFLLALAALIVFNLICVLTPELNQIGANTVFDWLNYYPYLLGEYGINGVFGELTQILPVNAFLMFLHYLIIINIGLGVFNLFPIPPLDGSKIVGAAIPDRYYYPILRYERYGFLVLIVLLYTGVLDTPLNFLRENLLAGLQWIAGLPFALLGGHV